MKKNAVAVIIPAYNEEDHISGVVQRVKKVDDSYFVIVVNDGSRDQTVALAESAGADIVLSHKVNLGKGGAAKTGCDYAVKNGFSTLVLIDADGQHEPEDIPEFVKALQKNDIVFGARHRDGKSPLLMKFGNDVMNYLTRVFFSMKLHDTQCGFRAFSAKTYTQVRWNSSSYGMETEMIYRAKGLSYIEVPIKRIYFDDYKGTTPIHGIKILFEMIKWKFFR